MGGSEDMDDGCAVIGRGSAGAEERYNRDDDSPALAHAQTFSSPGKIQPLPPGNEIIIYNYSSLSRPRHPHHRTLDPLLPRCLPYRSHSLASPTEAEPPDVATDLVCAKVLFLVHRLQLSKAAGFVWRLRFLLM